MPNKMLIDATHPEETRVVVVRGSRVEEFDFESAQRKQLRGNIYLAKVTRVEPSLQAAFVEYGGNRHGFLAFSEIHPDYYQIPVADRQALIEDDERAHREAEAEAENRQGRRRSSRHRHSRRRGGPRQRSGIVENAAPGEEAQPQLAEQPWLDENGVAAPVDGEARTTDTTETPMTSAPSHDDATPAYAAAETPAQDDTHHADDTHDHHDDAEPARSDDMPEVEDEPLPEGEASEGDDADAEGDDADENGDEHGDDENEEDAVESVGGADAMEEVQERTFRPRRTYKIQEVIKRRQVLLVQVVKEERGNKGAALTTYLSLAGRYSVLMPNTARGGGISRKITSSQDRARLKDLVQDLDVPEGMGIILRTAGASRTKPDINRDFEYLLRMWEQVRDLTLRSTAPTLVYEEGSLIKRSIRDLYNKDIEEIVVAGETGYKEAHDFVHMLMPGNERAVKHYRDPQPLFAKAGIESQLDAMFTPTVQLRSGGYIVINQTEALVSIDVNSGRATREHHIEDTALKTNLEAAEEVARQLRLRDLAGLIVIDFIDMDEKRNNRAVERKMSDCLKHDRARIQVGRISHFGLLEMSRQRIRASVLESSTEVCPHCGGLGHVRSVSSVALQLLRAIEEMLMRGATHNLIVRTRTDVALYVLNHKRAHLRDLEDTFKVTIAINADATMSGPQSYTVERGEQAHTPEAARALLAAQNAAIASASASEDETSYSDEPYIEGEAGDDTLDETEAASVDDNAETTENGDDRPRRKRRRRGRGGRRDGRPGEARDEFTTSAPEGEGAPADAVAGEEFQDEGPGGEDDEDETPSSSNEPRSEGDRKRRRRGRRGGRRRRTIEEGGVGAVVNEIEGMLEPVEVEVATADLDGVSRQFPPAQLSQEPAPLAAPAVTPAPANEDASQPRRRSTVREKVSFSFGEQESAPPQPAPNPEPAASPAQTSESESPSADSPRKAGWWSRRFGNGE
jgi:ribonuclease E